MEYDISETSMNIIFHAGNAKYDYMEAIKQIKNNMDPTELINDAKSELTLAHKYQTDILQKEAQGISTAPNILLVHAQDHLTMATMAQDFATEFIDLYKELNEIKKAIKSQQ